ncbi:MAG TPA: ComEC/Rec2 family competence protein, partial [Vicinamibacterales bacterium]|nr:ComEC/Rec2 family competence protein [Vicinamibacterales bacterium]
PPPPRERDTGRVRRTARGIFFAARTLSAATICAEIALAPVGARLFGRLTFAGLVLNFAAIPLMSVIQIAGLAAAAVAPMSTRVAAAAGWIAHVSTVALLGSARLVDKAPWLVRDLPPPALWLIGVWYLGWAGILIGRGRAVRVVAGLTVCASAVLILIGPRVSRAFVTPSPPPGWTRVVVLDVGQGDATLVWAPGARPILVDAGGVAGSAFDLGRRVTVPASWAFGVRSLDALVLTHGDPDHIGGAPAVLRALAPSQVWEGIPVPRHEPLRRLRAAADRAGIPWVEKRSGQTLTLGAASIRILNPPDPDWERQKVRNDDSIVLEVRVGDVAFVLPGDITQAVEPSVAALFDPAPLVIVKAPHHGSPGSSSPRFIASTHPSAVVFSAGRRNPFGHPAPLVVDRYRAAGAHVFNTAEDGAVVMDTDGKQVMVWTWTGRRLLLHAPPALHKDH